jgi:TupA-like ATPgrasp
VAGLAILLKFVRKLALRGLQAVAPAYAAVMRDYRHHFGETRLFLFPRTFNELIQHRKLFDRNPLLTLTSDKSAVRDYVERKVGARYLVPLYAVADDPEGIDFAALPAPFVAKATHGSGFNVFVRAKEELDRPAIVAALRNFQAIDWSEVYQEWAYKGIPRRIIVEKMLSLSGEIPADYKFFAFHGRVRFVQYDVDRHTGHMTKNSFDEAWRPLAVEYYSPRAARPIEKPALLAEMIRVSEALAAEFDFVRVDLYCFDGRIYFGELTHYPNAGLVGFAPHDFDRALGDVWRRDAPIPLKYYLE